MPSLPTSSSSDPDLRPPRYRPPPGACDAHCHIAPADPLDFERMQRALGLQRAVLVNPNCRATDNGAIAAAIAASEGQCRGIANADDSFSEENFKDLHEAGFRGVRFNFVKESGGAPDMGEFHRIIGRIKTLPWHVDLDFDAADLAGYEELLHELPLPFVIDHMGRIAARAGPEQQPFRQLLALLSSSPRCWVKISGAERISQAGPPFTDAVPFARALIETAPDRILWGSDRPHAGSLRFVPLDAELVDLIPAYAPDAAVQRQILVDNPRRLYGFEL